jgi:hypothetical protein
MVDDFHRFLVRLEAGEGDVDSGEKVAHEDISRG